MQKAVLLTALLCLLCSASLGAQERWMVSLTGSRAVSETFHFYLPQWSVGVEAAYFPLVSGNFRLGAGVGVSAARQRTSHPQIQDWLVYFPAFVRARYDFPLARLGMIAALDIGYPITFGLPAKAYTKHSVYVTPQIGVKIGNHLYASVCAWCPWSLRGYRVDQGAEPAGRLDHQNPVYSLAVLPMLKVGMRF